MALTKVYKPTKFAALFQEFSADYETLDEVGVKVEVKSNAFSVQGPHGENIVGNIGLAQGAVSLAAQGNLPAIAMAPVKAAIKSAYKHALKSGTWAAVFEDDIDAEQEMEAAAFKDIDLTKKMDVVIPATGMDKPKVKLSEAGTMYQPVKSSSESSTYHLIGATVGGLKFAARRNEQSLSIRVEGPVAEHKVHLIAAGFNESYISKGYTSVHFHGVDDLMAARALGAVLLGTEQTFTTPIPDLSFISGKGA